MQGHRQETNTPRIALNRSVLESSSRAWHLGGEGGRSGTLWGHLSGRLWLQKGGGVSQPL